MISHLLNRELTVARGSRVEDPYGGGTDTVTTVGTVLGRVSRPSPAEREVAAREGVRVTHTAYFDPGVDVRRGDTLTGDGQAFEVISIVAPSRPDYLIVELREDLP